MQDKTKNIIITVGFITILIVVFLLNIISKDKTISITERRKLAQFPEITLTKIANGDVMKKLEEYTIDQFIARDFFTGLKSFFNTNIYNQKDNNMLFEKDGAIYKMQYPLNGNNVKKSAKKINEVYEKYLQNMNVYYAIIPDKNYYLEKDDHLKIDYNKLKEIVNNELYQMKYIDIWDSLTLSDYYRTDLHWKQENLFKVVNKIENNMNLNTTSQNNYKIKNEYDFYGTYYGQLKIKIEPDKLYTLTNETIENCTTYNFENQKNGKVYDYNKTVDKYDVYLSGAVSIISIENPKANNQKELLLFRDSFGSSIAPLLVENYSKITLIDLRYISSQLLDKYIKFENQDVLFLYSTVILNQNILK